MQSVRRSRGLTTYFTQGSRVRETRGLSRQPREERKTLRAVMVEIGNLLDVSAQLALVFFLQVVVDQVSGSKRIVRQIVVFVGPFHLVGHEQVLSLAAKQSIDRTIANGNQIGITLKTVVLFARLGKQRAAKSRIIGNRPVSQQEVERRSYVDVKSNRLRIVIHALPHRCGKVKNERDFQYLGMQAERMIGMAKIAVGLPVIRGQHDNTVVIKTASFEIFDEFSEAAVEAVDLCCRRSVETGILLCARWTHCARAFQGSYVNVLRLGVEEDRTGFVGPLVDHLLSLRSGSAKVLIGPVGH